jgi:hypothetical protein
LAVGAFEHIVAENQDLEPKWLRRAMTWYCNSTPYLQAIAAGGHRLNLDGTIGEKVELEHQAHATAKLAARQAQYEARRRPGAIVVVGLGGGGVEAILDDRAFALVDRMKKVIPANVVDLPQPTLKRDGLAGLRAAAARRKGEEVVR